MKTRTALVTGGGSIIGQAITLCLAQQGYDVVIHYQKSHKAAIAAAAAVRQQGQKAAIVQANLNNAQETTLLVQRAAAAVNRPLDVLVNNASIFKFDTLHTITPENWHKHITINLYAPIVLTRCFYEQSPKVNTDEHGETYGHALVVNIVDQRIAKPTDNFLSYTLSKMGLWSFTHMAAQTLAPKVRVNAIAPGWIVPSKTESQHAFRTQRLQNIMKRGGNIDDITQTLSYFITAQSVTGQVVYVDGGQHLTPPVAQ